LLGNSPNRFILSALSAGVEEEIDDASILAGLVIEDSTQAVIAGGDWIFDAETKKVIRDTLNG
jgi:hypothetical protein